MSLRTRLLAGMATIAVLLVAVSALITVTTRDYLMDQVDERLTGFAVRPLPDIDPGAIGDLGDVGDVQQPPPQPGGFPDFPNRLSDVYQGVVEADGTLRTWFAPDVGGGEIGVPDFDPAAIVGDTVFFTTDAVGSDDTYRVLAQRFGDRVQITGVLIDDEQATIQRLVLVELIGVTAILAGLGVVTWWMLRLGIRPVKEMTETATRIADGDLSVRVPEQAANTEPGELAVALNRMLGQIESALDERAASQERLRQFVADASHELRTPITTIRGYAELYRHGGLATGEQLDDAMRRTEQEAARMGRLVDDMLVLAKLDQQRPLESKPVDLARLATDAAADARATAPTRAIELDIAAAPAIVDGDEDRLRQVIANVVANALVHTGADVPVAIRVAATDDAVTLEVVDHGPGMTPEISDRVTERFFRADPARSRDRGGSGLGLSIVDAAVSAHGGSVEIDSEVGRGTTVRLTMPAAGPAS